jgi:hypothetical protein
MRRWREFRGSAAGLAAGLAAGGAASAALAMALAAALTLSATPLSAEEGSPAFTLGGSFDTRAFASYAQGLAGSSAANSDFGYGSASTLGLELRVQKGALDSGFVGAEASIEAALLTGSAAASAWALAASGLREPDELLLPAYAELAAAPESAIRARIRTLYIKAAKGNFSAEAGRQVVNFGSGELWRPVDIFDELDLSGLSPTRRGSDALRLNAALGDRGELALVGRPTADFSRGGYALRAKGDVAGIDLGLIAAREGSRGSWIAGGDARADLGISLYAEAVGELSDSVVDGIDDGVDGSGGEQASARVAAGTDWSTPIGQDGRLLLAAEYYYNGSGAVADPEFPGSHNAYASAAWVVDEYLELSLNCVWALSEGSVVATAAAALDLAQGAALDIFARVTRSDATGDESGEAANISAQAGAGLRLYF